MDNLIWHLDHDDDCGPARLSPSALRVRLQENRKLCHEGYVEWQAHQDAAAGRRILKRIAAIAFAVAGIAALLLALRF